MQLLAADVGLRIAGEIPAGSRSLTVDRTAPAATRLRESVGGLAVSSYRLSNDSTLCKIADRFGVPRACMLMIRTGTWIAVALLAIACSSEGDEVCASPRAGLGGRCGCSRWAGGEFRARASECRAAGYVHAPGIPATSQVPRLLNRQYDAVLRDLLGVSGGVSTTPGCRAAVYRTQ
jgi:hypothetical protein